VSVGAACRCRFTQQTLNLVAFDATELERADMKSLFESYRIALGRAGEPGFMSVNEVRARMSLKRIDGGDELNKGTMNAPEPAAKPPIA
jgi:hypothetical protein